MFRVIKGEHLRSERRFQVAVKANNKSKLRASTPQVVNHPQVGLSIGMVYVPQNCDDLCW